MTWRSRLIGLASLGLLLFLSPNSCTDSDLYQWTTPPYQPNKLTVSATVCTDDLNQTDFPKKILFMVDVSDSLRGSANDPNGLRGKAVQDMITRWGGSPNYSFGVTIFGAKAKNLLTDASGQKPVSFTDDKQKLLAAANQIKTGGGFPEISKCRPGRCRDLRAALSLASSMVTGDILASDPGQVARTTYVLVLFSGGPPVPAIGRCACRDLDDEKKDGAKCKTDDDCKNNRCLAGACMNEWEGCPWTECDCKVTCNTAISKCVGSSCIPVCSPACQTGYYCDDTFSCVLGTPVAPPTIEPIAPVPPSVADTFTVRVLPPKVPGACNKLPSCVYKAGGHPGSCEEKILIKDVLELKSFAVKEGAGAFQLHTVYLPDGVKRTCTAATATAPRTCDPFYPPPRVPAGQAGHLTGCSGSADADRARTVRLLSQMAYAGNGGLEKRPTAVQISNAFKAVGSKVFASQDALVFKELVVSNENVIADGSGIHADTDADGLSDETEKRLGTCLSDEDSDGDGLGDAVEVKLATDPTKPDKVVECVDLTSTRETGADPCDAKGKKQKTWTRFTVDKDKDGLNQCEERRLGTDDTLFDHDADGIPDRVEFIAGTNYLAVDSLQDSDMDGVVNREEIRGHTDPRSNDAQGQIGRAYRYEVVDEGLQEVIGFTQPTNITGVRIKNVSAQTTKGRGWLKFTPGSGKNPPTLAWRDHADTEVGGGFGPAVDISRPSKDGYKLTSCRLVAGGGCTPDSALKFITVQVDGAKAYLPAAMVEKINISSAKRNCVRFTVRNITLVQTGMHRLLKTRGNNTVVIYFAEAPSKAKSGHGIFRITSKRFVYTEGPPARRTPKDAVVHFTDDDFALDID